MTESLAVHASISVSDKASQSGKRKKFLLLSSDLLSTPTLTEDNGGRDQELCSSARVHPETQEQLETATRLTKEIAFIAASDQYKVEFQANENRVSGSKEPEQEEHTTPLRHTQNNTSAFLSKPRPTIEQQSSNPPVGHYHPRMKIVEPTSPSIAFTKTERQLGQVISEVHDHVAPTKRAANSTPTSSAPTKSPVLAPSSGFRSIGREQREKTMNATVYASSPSNAIVNDAAFTKNSPVFSMKLVVGRDSGPGIAPPMDKCGAMPPAKHSPCMSFDSSPPRSNVLVEPKVIQVALNTENFAVAKFRRSPALDFGKARKKVTQATPSAGAVGTRASEYSVTPLFSVARHSPTVDIAKLPNRAMGESRSASEMTYNVDYTPLLARSPVAFIAPLSPKPHGRQEDAPPAAMLKQPTVADADRSPVRRRLAHDIDFRGYISREKASKVGRMPQRTEALSTVSELRPLTDEIGVDCRGDPKMGTHVSRDQREQARCARACSPDAIYDVKLPETAVGYVAFGKMVSREKHRGSHFTGEVV